MAFMNSLTSGLALTLSMLTLEWAFRSRGESKSINSLIVGSSLLVIKASTISATRYGALVAGTVEGDVGGTFLLLGF